MWTRQDKEHQVISNSCQMLLIFNASDSWGLPRHFHICKLRYPYVSFSSRTRPVVSYGPLPSMNLWEFQAVAISFQGTSSWLKWGIALVNATWNSHEKNCLPFSGFSCKHEKGIMFLYSCEYNKLAFVPRMVYRFQISTQWEFQDPKMKVLYHIRPYFLVIFPYIGLT